MNRHSISRVCGVAVVLATFLAAGCSGRQGGAAAVLFAERCAPCHGDRGKGVTGSAAPPLDRQQFIYGRSQEAITASIRDGRPREMPAYGGFFSREQIDGLVTYILGL